MTQVYMASMMSLAVLPIVVIGYFWVSHQFQQFHTSISEYRQSYLNTRKQYLQDHVDGIIADIDQRRRFWLGRVRKDLEDRSEEAHGLISVLYKNRAVDGFEAHNQFLHAVTDILGAIHFHNNRGAYAVLDADGNILLDAQFLRRNSVGANSAESPGPDDKVKAIIRLAKNRGKGFVGLGGSDAEDSYTIAYVQRFDPLGLIILTGDYGAGAEQFVKQQIINTVRNAKYSVGLTRPFIIGRNGKMLAYSMQFGGGGQQTSPPSGYDQDLVRMYRNTAGSSPGGFLEYQRKLQGGDESVGEISFVREYPRWGWVIGSAFSLDQVDSRIAGYHEELQTKISREIAYGVVGLLLILIIAIWMANWLARKTSSGFRQFNRFFDDASRSSSHIDKSLLPYSEFTDLAENANLMIAERTRYERALRYSEQRFELALKYSQHYLWEIQLDSGIISISNGFFESLGYTEDECDFSRVATVSQLCHPDDLPVIKSGNAFRVRQEQGFELRIRDKWGSYRWFYSRGAMVKSGHDAGEGHRMLGIVTEITPRKLMEEELVNARIAAEDASYAKSQFLATVSHELRTPLNGILGYAQLLVREENLTAEQRHNLESISECGEHLLAIIGDILALSKIESGIVEVSYEESRVSIICQELSDIAGAQARIKGLEYQWEIDPTVPELVSTDATKIKQILVNLISNAIKFTRQGWVKLSVTCDESSGSLLFLVSDSGMGIEDKDLQSIFEPFRQVGGSGAYGTGLGLAVSRRLAEALGGELNVSSRVGVGSEFRLSVPCKAIPVEPLFGGRGTRLRENGDNGNYPPVPRKPAVELGAESLELLRGAVRVGDIEALTSLLRTMLEQAEGEELRGWLQRGLELVEQFDLEAVERLLREVTGPEALV